MINVNQALSFLKPKQADPWIDSPFPLHWFKGRKQTNEKMIL